MERLRSFYAGGNVGMFDVSYWSYSKVALKQSLTAMQDPSVEELALKVFNSILIYSGVIDAGRDWGWVLAKKKYWDVCAQQRLHLKIGTQKITIVFIWLLDGFSLL